MNLNSLFTSLNIKNDYYNSIKLYLYCMDCKNNSNKNLFNTNSGKSNINNNDDNSYIIQLKGINNTKKPKLKKRWLNYHYEILRKCIILFGDDISKIKFFLNEFSVNEIRKKINYYKNYSIVSIKKRNNSISAYMNILDSDLNKSFDLNDTNSYSEDKDLFSIDDFILKKSNQKLNNSICNNLDESLNSLKTLDFYEKKDYNKFIDEEEINDELDEIFKTNEIYN